MKTDDKTTPIELDSGGNEEAQRRAMALPDTPRQADPAAQGLPIAGGKPKSALIHMEKRGVQLKTMEELFLFSRAVMESGLAPKGFSTQQQILVAIQMGMELGLTPMASLSNIAVINGRATVYGDAVPAVCNHLVDSYKDEMFGTMGDDSYGCRVTIKRKGRSDEIVRAFTIGDAKKAGLWGKQGPWSQYPNRMLLMRARTFCYRDSCPEALRGIITTEEFKDHPEIKNVTTSLDQLDNDTPKNT